MRYLFSKAKIARSEKTSFALTMRNVSQNETPIPCDSNSGKNESFNFFYRRLRRTPLPPPLKQKKITEKKHLQSLQKLHNLLEQVDSQYSENAVFRYISRFFVIYHIAVASWYI